MWIEKSVSRDQCSVSRGHKCEARIDEFVTRLAKRNQTVILSEDFLAASASMKETFFFI